MSILRKSFRTKVQVEVLPVQTSVSEKSRENGHLSQRTFLQTQDTLSQYAELADPARQSVFETLTQDNNEINKSNTFSTDADRRHESQNLVELQINNLECIE